MGLSFFETMRGEVVDKSDEPHAIDFELKGEATEISRFLRGGEVKVTGIVNAPPFAERAPLEGRMVISPLRRRRITYEFRFCDPQGRSCRFEGKKEISFLRPVSSMTEMEGAICREGETVAEGELFFDLGELPEFLNSWRPTTTIPRADMHAPLGACEPDEALSEAERATLDALVEATFVAGEHVPGADEKTCEETARQIQMLPSHAYWLHRFGLRLLERVTLVSHRRSFSDLELDTRRELLDRWTDPARQAGRRMELPAVDLAAQLLTVFVKMAHFGRYDYLDAIGHPRPEKVAPEPKERYMRRVVPAEYLEKETELRAHVVVVGTGAGGAAVAYQLAKNGLAVAMVEEGRYLQRDDFSGPPMERMWSMYRHRSTNFSMGTPIVIPQGRAVGGTTTINSGTCFATPDHVLKEWRREQGFPEGFRPENYHRYSQEVAGMLQVEPGDEDALGRIADVIGRGADEMGIAHGALPRNAPGCTGAGECILGCPEGAKRSTDISYVPAALRAGAELYTGLPMTRILMHGDRAVAVEARGADRHGRPRRLRIHADRVVLACGAIHSPILLHQNGFRNRHIGKNLSVHPGMGLLARMHEELEPWKTIPQGYTFEALEDREIQFEGYYLHPQLTAGQLPWVGEKLTRWMDDFSRIAQFGFMVRDRGRGSVRCGPDGVPMVRYTLSEKSIEKLKAGAAVLSELFFEAGASEVFTGFGAPQVLRSIEEARALEDVDAGPLDFRLLGAHPLGTCRMAADESRGVVDFDHRLFGTENLHVVDGSTVPTSLGVNPQMTIMAMALRAGDVIAEKMHA